MVCSIKKTLLLIILSLTAQTAHPRLRLTLPKKKSTPAVDLQLFSSDNRGMHTSLCSELKQLEKTFGYSQPVSLENRRAQTIAPRLYTFLHKNTQAIAKRAHMPMPKISIRLAPSKELYNTGARTYFWGRHDSITDELISLRKETTLIFGAAFIRLIAWKQNTVKTLQTTIGHELGHAYHNHGYYTSLDKQAEELEADAFAACVVNDPSLVIKDLNLTTLASSMYSFLDSLPMTIEAKLEFTERVASALVDTIPDLGKLGTCQTHTQFHSLIHTALHQSLINKKCRKKSFSKEKDRLMQDAYNKIKAACTQPESLIDISLTQLERECEQLEADEEETPTHPAPGPRLRHLKTCCQVLNNKKLTLEEKLTVTSNATYAFLQQEPLSPCAYSHIFA